MAEEFINDAEIYKTLNHTARQEAKRVQAILNKAAKQNGLSMDEIAVLINISDPQLLDELFKTTRRVKEETCGKRLVIFAPCTFPTFARKNAPIVPLGQKIRLFREGH